MTHKEKLIDIRNQINQHLSKDETPLPPPDIDSEWSIELHPISIPLTQQTFQAGTPINFNVRTLKNGRNPYPTDREVVWLTPAGRQKAPIDSNGNSGIHRVVLSEGGMTIEAYIEGMPNVRTKFRINATGSYSPPPPTSPPTLPPTAGSVEIGGTTYKTVEIGNQIWLADNLRNTFGLKQENDPKKWVDNTNPLCAVYGNIETYGRLYNHYALSHFDLPSGWRVSSDEDWKELESQLGMSSNEIDIFSHRGSNGTVGVSLKSTKHFAPPISDKNHHYYNPKFIPATNSTGFSAVPSGSLNPYDTTHDGADFYSLFRDCDIWTSTKHGDNAIYRALSFNRNGVFRAHTKRGFGMAVRLVRNS